MRTDFEELLGQIEREAEEEGPEAVARLRALEFKYRMVSELIGARHRSHLTQKELAERAGVGQAEISKIERGRKSPTLDTYGRLAGALGLDVRLSPRGRSRSRVA